MKQVRNSRPLSWEPVWRGAIYCAPACGAGCLRSEYNRAVRAADELARQLGPGWTPRVWANLSWHYSAISPCGRLKVSPCMVRLDRKITSWIAFLGEGETGGRWAEHARTPQSAIRNVVRRGREELAGIDALLRDLPVPGIARSARRRS